MEKLSSNVTSLTKQRFISTLEEQKKSYQKIIEGRPLDAEENWERKQSFIINKLGVTQQIANQIANYVPAKDLKLDSQKTIQAESIQGETIDFIGTCFLDLGKAASRCIGRIVIASTGAPRGTGFMVSENLLLTNNHVVPDENAARDYLVEFCYEKDYLNKDVQKVAYRLDPDKFFITSPESELDFTLVALGGLHQGELETPLGFLPLFATEDKHIKGMPVNCIQHPEGRFKQLVVRKNALLARTVNTIIYSSDTERGSSGSPICNDDWEVIALHHYGAPYRAIIDGDIDQIGPLPKQGNEGIRISAIIKHLSAISGLNNGKQVLLNSMLSHGFREPSLMRVTKAPVTGNPKPENLNDAGSTGTAFGGGGPESFKFEPDPSYLNRKGYSETFLGINVPLPTLQQEQIDQAAVNQQARPTESKFEFKYQHFTVVMHGKRRLAFFTAVNIDGASVVSINRETGEVRGGPEGRETWYEDPRIDETEVCQDSWYLSSGMHIFHRGHLVKRTDPSWANEDRAMKAQADTFHFLNCAPQHSKFNPNKAKWAGIEDWITKTSDDQNIRISVFSGPVLDDEDESMHGIKIPKAYWKVICWVDDGNLRSLALLADQSDLIKNMRDSAAAEDLQEIPEKLQEFHVPVSYVSKITNLDFGKLTRGDIFVGGEALNDEKKPLLTLGQLRLK